MTRRRTIESGIENDTKRVKIILSRKNKSLNKKRNNNNIITSFPSKKTTNQTTREMSKATLRRA